MNKPIIEVKNLSKKYTLGERQPYYSFRDTISGVFNTPFRRKKLEKDEFWALKDVSFDINQGDVVGVIGRNGAGKSTLLKILSQITPPTEGEVKLRGRVASLLEVGTGFHPELTGRENIYLNGAILGMKRWEINSKYKEIVEFSEIEKFLNTPVKHYSSGMYMRLAFSVAAHLEPEILLVDEVLAVGDTEFQKKCLGKMSEVSKQGRTVLFVSHNMGAVRELCPKAILLESGKVILVDSSKTVIKSYIDKASDLITSNLSDRLDREGTGVVKFTEVYLENKDNQKVFTADSGSPIYICCRYSSRRNTKLKDCVVSLVFFNRTGNRMFKCSSEVSHKGRLDLKGKGVIRCYIPKLPLSEGNYRINLFISQGKEVSDSITDGASIDVIDGIFFKPNFITPPDWKTLDILVSHKWFT